MHDTCSQAFRSTSSSSSSDIINIPACHDPTTSQRVVRWKDIQQYFENAQGVMNGKDAVIFLTNNNLEDLIPLRIAHHPGVVLEVTDRSQSSSSTSQTLDSTSITMGTSSLRITEVDDDDQALAVDPPSEGISLRDPSPVYSTDSSQYVVLHQESSEPNTSRCIHDHLPQLQEQLQLLNQRTLELQQQIDEVRQARSKQPPRYHPQQPSFYYHERLAPRRMVEVEQPNRLSEQQTQHQRQQQLLDSTREEISQRQQDAIYRHSLVHYRIQELLNAPLGDLPAPRFFIVLPKDVGLNEGQRKSSSLSFRLHFLCDGISYLTSQDARNTRNTCEMHMTNHPGYDIKNPKEFFGKYGPYILTTMYMIKHGATGPGFVVPPLAHSRLVARIEENVEYLASVRKDIGRLMDIAISYLEDTPSIDNESSAISHWSLTLADQAELKSYLESVEGEHFPGDLHRLASQERHCAWMCREHRHEWIIQHLKDVVNTAGGTYSEDSEKIMINCGTEEERLYDAMIKFCKAQTTNDPSLSADIGQLSLAASASKEGQEVYITINRLGDLTVDGIKFIQQCNLTKLMVKSTPGVTDEDRLVDILNQCHELKELHIRCNGERSYAIIHLVISTKGSTIREGRTSALHILKVTDERWDPFDYHSVFDENDHIVSTVTFSRGSAVFDMDTDMKMQCQKPVDEGSPISNFIREYGWSISRLFTSWHFTDHLATLLDNAIEERGSRLTHLTFSPFALSTPGLDAVDRVIKRSQCLTFLWLYCVYLEMESQSERALFLLGRYGERLNRLTLNSTSFEKWLVPFTRVLPTASSFHRLDHIYVWCPSKCQVPPEFIQWLVAVAQDRPPSAALSSNEGSSEGKTLRTRNPCTIMARMSSFTFSNVTLCSQDWEILIKAIDLSELRELYLRGTNFSAEQLDQVLDRIAAADANSVSLKVLQLSNSDVVVDADKPALQARIQKAVPQMSIQL